MNLIYKYRSSKKDSNSECYSINELKKRELTGSLVTEFSKTDPNEFSVRLDFNKIHNQSLEKDSLIKVIDKINSHLALTNAICCFTLDDDFKNPRKWEMYCQSKGFILAYDLDQLRLHSLKGHMRQVEYITSDNERYDLSGTINSFDEVGKEIDPDSDNGKIITSIYNESLSNYEMDLIYDIVFKKDKKWAFEKEYRFWFNNKCNNNKKHPLFFSEISPQIIYISHKYTPPEITEELLSISVAYNIKTVNID